MCRKITCPGAKARPPRGVVFWQPTSGLAEKGIRRSVARTSAAKSIAECVCIQKTSCVCWALSWARKLVGGCAL
eukprot:5585890-Prymnesium_polylepis.1